MWLAIDTATDRASVALGATTETALEENLRGARRHASQLLIMIDTLLGRADVTLNEVTGIALSDGPGSFTGLRVGAMVAKALVRTRGLPLVTAPSLLVRAAQVAAPADGGAVLAVANALRGEVFAAMYRFTSTGVLTELAPTVSRPEALVQGSLRPTLVVGDVPADAAGLLESWVGRPVVASPEGAPHAAWLIDLVQVAGGAVPVGDVPSWEPVYGRPAEAQVVWEMTHGRPLPNPIGSTG